MTDANQIIVLVEALKKERDDAIAEKSKQDVEIWRLKDELRKQKEETEKWKNLFAGKV